MILQSYGSEGGKSFLRELVSRARKPCEKLDELSIEHFRDPYMNAITG